MSRSIATGETPVSVKQRMYVFGVTLVIVFVIVLLIAFGM